MTADTEIVGPADGPKQGGALAALWRPTLSSARPLLFGIVVLLAGCGLTYAFYVGAREKHEQHLGHEFVLESVEIYQRLQRSIDWHVDILSALAGLYSASTEGTEAELKTFVLPSLDRQPHIGMLGWAPRVAPDDWAEQSARLRAAGAAGIVDAATGSPYAAPPDRDVFPVSYSVVAAGFALDEGEDLWGEVEFRLAMAWARDSGLPTATRPLRDRLGDRGGNAVLIVAPLYRSGAEPVDYVQRRRALTGFVFLAVAVDVLVDWAVQDQSAVDLDIHLADIGMPPGRGFVYHFDAATRSTRDAAPADPADEQFLFHRDPLRLATRAWRAYFTPTDRFLARYESTQPTAVLVVGLLMTVLLAAFSLREARRTESVKLLVHERTQALEEEVKKRREAQQALRSQVAALEETRDRLEQQGRQLTEIAQDLARARDKADAASAAKSAFLATMSHELRTPLNAIIGFAELIRDQLAGDIGDQKYCDYARDIHSSGQHLLALINDILDVSKAEAGKLEINDEPVDVAEEIDASIRLCQPRALSAGTTLVPEIAAALPLLKADRRRLKQILINLITNALKFSGNAGNVTIRARVDAAGWMVIEVEDFGIGMSEGEIDEALEPFGQLDTSINRRHPGTGLGLPLTKSMVEVHGGRLEIDSRLGEGTVVRALFPARRIVARSTGRRGGSKAAAGRGGG
ncbi:MAG: hypothetical protein HKM95_07630 [Inquilinus sp.]|nr:hypothetical protein [Inquilinus sp.]